MGRTSETKNRILELLRGGNKRLVDLYPALELSPATVSQHLKELKGMGLISEVDNSHFKNEKYYTLGQSQNKGIGPDGFVIGKSLRDQLPKFGFVTTGIVAAALLATIFFSKVPGPYGSTLNILLTDPPHVPLGTQALNITYSSIQVHLANASPDSWINVNAAGTVDLLSLVNMSKVIGSVNMPANSMIDMAAFNITNAKIVIGNVSYPVSLGSDRVVGDISNREFFNGSSDLLVDFSPTIVTLYNANSTSFEMVPSVRALMVDKQQFAMPMNGPAGKILMDNEAWRRINDSGASIAVTNASITAQGNRTDISLVIKDTSNRSVDLYNVILSGNESLYLNTDWFYVSGNASRGTARRVVVRAWNGAVMPTVSIMRFRESGKGGMLVATRVNFTNAYNWSTGDINYSWKPVEGLLPPMPNGAWAKMGVLYMPVNINVGFGPGAAAGMATAYRVGMAKAHLGVMSLIINNNATLSEPSLPGVIFNNTHGYWLQPGQSVALSFNGTLGLGNGLLTATFTNGTYTVAVVGSDGAFADSTINVG